MEKIYLVFTVHEDNFYNNKTVTVDCFKSKEEAIGRIHLYTDAQVVLEKAESTDTFGIDFDINSFIPGPIKSMFWGMGKILYGKTVTGKFKDTFNYTYRFMVEKNFED